MACNKILKTIFKTFKLIYMGKGTPAGAYIAY